jgi:N4-gp56 family major capsid protein
MKNIKTKLLMGMVLIPLVINLFDTDTQVTTLTAEGNDISPEMKTFYHERLLDYAEPELVYDIFAQKVPIPAGKGKTIEFRKYPPLKKALTKLTEGVTPTGNNLDYTTLTCTPDQYGDFTKISDVLKTTAYDSQIDVSTKRHGSQSGRTQDTVTREIVTAGTNKIYAPLVAADTGIETEVLLRASITDTCYLTAEVLSYAKAILARENTGKIEGAFGCIIHTDIERDVMRELGEGGWLDAAKYASPEAILAGEIGMYDGIRFYKSTEAKIIGPADMLGIEDYNRTTLHANVTTSTDIYPEDVFTVAQAAVINAAIAAGTEYTLYVDEVERTVASVTGGAVGVCKITLTESISESADDPVCGTGAGTDGSAVYCTMMVGAEAYGVSEIEGLGLEHIICQLGSAGTADPLKQRATVGWKATRAAVRLMEQYMIRIEHTSKKFRLTAISN